LGGRQCELELSASWPAQAQTTEPKDALEMCKQHLNTFAIAARSFECFGLGQRNFGATSLAAPNAASSSLARYSLVARGAFGSRSENSMITYSTGAGRSVLAQWRGRLRHAQEPV
jgi:hypothetical protein